MNPSQAAPRPVVVVVVSIVLVHVDVIAIAIAVLGVAGCLMGLSVPNRGRNRGIVSLVPLNEGFKNFYGPSDFLLHSKPIDETPLCGCLHRDR